MKTTHIFAKLALAVMLIMALAFAAIKLKSEYSTWKIIDDAQTKVANTLIDPPAAKFRNVTVTSLAVCGEVNAKNSYGAYVGFARFANMIDSKLIDIDDGSDLSEKLISRMCKTGQHAAK